MIETGEECLSGLRRRPSAVFWFEDLTFGTELGATLATRPGALGMPELGSPLERSEIPTLGFRKDFVVYQDMLVRMRRRGKMS